jgi:hypothetical protein
MNQSVGQIFSLMIGQAHLLVIQFVINLSLNRHISESPVLYSWPHHLLAYGLMIVNMRRVYLFPRDCQLSFLGHPLKDIFVTFGFNPTSGHFSLADLDYRITILPNQFPAALLTDARVISRRSAYDAHYFMHILRQSYIYIYIYRGTR